MCNCVDGDCIGICGMFLKECPFGYEDCSDCDDYLSDLFYSDDDFDEYDDYYDEY